MDEAKGARGGHIALGGIELSASFPSQGCAGDESPLNRRDRWNRERAEAVELRENVE